MSGLAFSATLQSAALVLTATASDVLEQPL